MRRYNGWVRVKRQRQRDILLLEPFTQLGDLVIAKRGKPKTFCQNLTVGLDVVSAAGIQKPQDALDDTGGSPVSLEVNQLLLLRRGGDIRGQPRCNERRFLGVESEISGVDAQERYHASAG